MSNVSRGLKAICPFIMLILFTISSDRLFAQELKYHVEKTYMQKLGHTRPLREILKEHPSPIDADKLGRGDKPSYVRNFVGRRDREGLRPDALPSGRDPLLHNSMLRNGGLATEPIVVFEGLNQSEASAGVPDVNGDVSADYYVEAVNATWLQVFDLQGNRVGNRFRAEMIWEEVDRQSAGDPIILYDEQVDRWFMTEFPPQNEVLVAISDTDDPMGAWTAYAFSTPRFPDYPKYGIWPEAYILTTNEGGSGLFFYLIDREAILNGDDMVNMQRFSVEEPDAPGFIVATPVGMTGTMLPDSTSKPMIVHMSDDAWGVVDEDRLDLFEVTIDWENEGNSVITPIELPTTPFDAEFCSVPGPNFSCVPQPNGIGIDGLPYVVMHRAFYRNFGTHEAIVLNFAIDVTGEADAGIRWVELRKTPGEQWSVYQEGTVGSDEGLNRFMGGIGIDAEGNIGLAYSVSSEAVFPSLRFTGRLADDPLGQMTIEEYEFATGEGSRSNSRFGDYASMSVDEQNVFWYAGEYIRANGQWGTKIVAFRLQRSENDLGPAGLLAPADAPDLDEESLSVSVINYGLKTQTDFDIGFIFNGQDPVVENVSLDSLPPDSVYEHTFAEKIQFGGFGNYPVMVFTSMQNDSNQINDTCVFIVRKLTRNDVAVPALGELPGVICDTFVDVLIAVQNAGIDTLRSATIRYSLNGGDTTSMPWTGELLTEEIDLVPVTFSGLQAGQNAVYVEVSKPNDGVDDNPQNDVLEEMLNATPGGGRVVLELRSDLYANETTWQLLDSNNNVLFQGGPLTDQYTTVYEEWCLDETVCYKFVLLDDYGDGIASGIDGDFVIRNSDGIIVARLDDPDFGFTDTTAFCLDYECAMQLTPIVLHESTPGASNGLVTLVVSGGQAPLMFSKDNGMTFQGTPSFPGLVPGDYTFMAKDAVGCEAQILVTILGCYIGWDATVTDATGPANNDGSILIMANGGNGPYEYSINGGQSYQPEALFENLLPDTYAVSARDSVRCRFQDSVKVDFTTSIKEITSGETIRIYPNPSSGEFYMEIEGLEDVYFLEYEILDNNGRVIDRRKAANYSGVIKSYFVITSYPPGTYYLRVVHPRFDTLVAVIKI